MDRPHTKASKVRGNEIVTPLEGGFWPEGRYNARMSRDKKDEPDLGSLPLKSVEDGTVRRLSETAVLAAGQIVFVSRAQPLGSVVESITKWFVDAFEGIALGHEDLAGD